jgi:hypothetical protein
VRSLEVFATQPLEFRWNGDASSYGGVIDGYRYGWDILDPNDEEDPGWSVGWAQGEAWLEAPTRSFLTGHHNFIVQTRDNSGTLSRIAYELDVVGFVPDSEKRDLLLIDDWGLGLTSFERIIQKRWDQRWISILGPILPSWSRSNDFVHSFTEPELVTFKKIREYRTIIWFTNGSSPSSALRNAIFPTGLGTPFNWMELYKRELGNILITGVQAMNGSFTGGGTTPIVLPQGDVSPFQWPMNDWCLEVVDYVRPGIGNIWCEEPGRLQRTRDCDRMMKATIPDSFYETYPSAHGYVNPLRPTTERVELVTGLPEYKLEFEEFYNINVTCREVTISLRDCQRTMFELRARRDELHPETGEPFIDDPTWDCWPHNRPFSPLNGVPVGIVNTTHSATKPVAGSEDFLWGFHPLAFEYIDIVGSLIWVLGERWQLPVERR